MANRYFRSGEVDEIFASMECVKATKYAHRVLGNKESPVSNKDAVAEYMSRHPEKFLTDAEVKADPGLMGRRSFFGGKKTRRPIAEVRSVEEISKAVGNMGTPLRRRMYLESIINNPDTPEATDRSPACTKLTHWKVESPMTQGKIAEGCRTKHGEEPEPVSFSWTSCIRKLAVCSE